MTQEYKELLIKDLSARLPYDVFVNIRDIKCVLQPHDISDLIKCDVDIKPYLIPLSSITKKQLEELEELCDMYTPDDDYNPYAYLGIKVLYKHVLDDGYKFKFKTDVIDWFNKNHLDYRGLIEKGLAIDATGKNIY